MSKPKPIPSATELQAAKKLFGESLNHEDDVTCAVVSTSYLDYCLGSLLKAHLVDGNTTAELLQPSRPLGELGARAKMAYCLGLIPRSMRDEIINVASVRNHFAHHFSKARFSDDRPVEACGKLNPHLAPKVKKNVDAMEPGRKARLVFQRTVHLLVNEILAAAAKTKHITGKDGDWLTLRAP